VPEDISLFAWSLDHVQDIYVYHKRDMRGEGGGMEFLKR
jgi:hypothetical protein